MVPGLSQMLHYIRNYYVHHFNLGYVIAVMLVLGLLIYQNYAGTGVSDLLATKELPPWLSRYILYCLPFFTAYLLQPLFFRPLRFQYKKGFWILLMLAPAFFTLRVQLNLSDLLPTSANNTPEDLSNSSVANLFFTSLLLLLPAALCWYSLEGRLQHGYGLAKTTNLKTYLLLLCIMLPFIALASSNPTFLEQYPRAFKAMKNPESRTLVGWLSFEILYAFDFFSTEFFFRSFLILAFVRLSGVHAIIPAACFYCCIHLDKPLAEAVSSFFGGWLLGIISYYSKSIWGGLLIHVGIAWFMELFAWLQHQ